MITMATFSTQANKNIQKAPEYFLKLDKQLDIEKYKLEKYKDLFMLASFQAMHDSDLAYHTIYYKCAQNAETKQSLLNYLEQEERFSEKNPGCFDHFNYRQQALKAISEIKQQIKSGALDFLYL